MVEKMKGPLDREDEFSGGPVNPLYRTECAECESLRTRLAEVERERDDWKDLLDFYFNHHMNTGGERTYSIDSPFGMHWRATQRVGKEWEVVDGPGERNDFRHPWDAIRELRRLAGSGYFRSWDIPGWECGEPPEVDAAREAWE